MLDGVVPPVIKIRVWNKVALVMGCVNRWVTQIGGAHVLLVTLVEYVTAHVTHSDVQLTRFPIHALGGHQLQTCDSA